jgi:hypothetical protein
VSTDEGRSIRALAAKTLQVLRVKLDPLLQLEVDHPRHHHAPGRSIHERRHEAPLLDGGEGGLIQPWHSAQHAYVGHGSVLADDVFDPSGRA